MEAKHIPDIEINIEEREYILGFDIDSVNAFGKYSVSMGGKISDEIFIKYALQKHHKNDLLGEKTALKIQETLASLDDDDDMTYSDVMEHLIRLFTQAIDDESKNIEPVNINIEKDNSVTIIFDGEKYKLTFNRSDIKDAIINGDTAFSFSNPLELYTIGTSLLKLATKHYNKRFSVKFHEKLFLSLWATKYIKETENMLPEVINALSFHITEVANSGIKNSKPVIRLMTKESNEQNQVN